MKVQGNSGGETKIHILEECRGLSGIRERHGVDKKIVELWLFCEPDNSKIERKRCVEDLQNERSRRVKDVV